MDKPPRFKIIDGGLSGEPLSPAQAFERSAAAIARVPHRYLVHAKVDVPKFVTRALDIARRLQAFKVDAAAMFKGGKHFDVRRFDRVERHALALVHAHALCTEAEAAAEGAERVRAARLVRDQAFTLFLDNYEEVRRALNYMRWDARDADEIAPVLYRGRQVVRDP